MGNKLKGIELAERYNAEGENGKWVATVEKYARTGDPECMAALGKNWIYSYGITEEKKALALNLLRRAAEAGCIEAYYELGRAYCHVGKREEAFDSYMKGFKRGDAQCAYMLGQMYYYGDVVERDVMKGIEILRFASRKGCGDASYVLGTIYDEGAVVRRNEAKAAAFYKDSALNGWMMEGNMELLRLSYLKAGKYFSDEEWVKMMHGILPVRRRDKVVPCYGAEGSFSHIESLNVLRRKFRAGNHKCGTALANRLYANGSPSDLEEAADVLTTMAYRHPYIWVYLADLLSDSPVSDGKIRAIEAAHKGFKAENLFAAWFLIYQAIQRGDFRLAEDYLYEAIAFETHETDRMYRALSYLYYYGLVPGKSYKDAVQVLERLRGTEEWCDELLYNLAYIYWKRGDSETALKMLDRNAVINMNRYGSQERAIMLVAKIKSELPGSDLAKLACEIHDDFRYSSLSTPLYLMLAWGNLNKKDCTAFLSELQELAEGPSSYASYYLALYYDNGINCKRDMNVANLYMEWAALCFVPEARFTMGQWIEEGRIKRCNYNDAMYYYGSSFKSFLLDDNRFKIFHKNLKSMTLTGLGISYLEEY